MAEALAFRSQDQEVFFHEGKSDFLFITFNEMGMRADGRHWWAAQVARRLGYAALGFVSTGPHWFPRRCIEEALADPAIAAILRRFPRRVVYGFSMGAYAAIKHSRVLGAEAIVALAPQWSIDPADTGGVDWRFTRFFRPDLHAGMAIGPADVGGRITIILDPRERQDAWNLDRIVTAIGDVTILPAYSTSHYTASALAALDTASELMAGALHDDPRRMQRAVARRRRQWARRPAIVLRQSAQRHPVLALPMLHRHAGSIAPAELVLAWSQAGRGFLRRGDYEHVAACIAQATAIEADAPDLLALRADSCLQQGDLAGAIQHARGLVDRMPGRPGPLRRLAAYLRRAGDVEGAAAVVAEAERIQPQPAA